MAGSDGMHILNTRELEKFREFLKSYAQQLSELDGKMKGALDQLGATYKDNSYTGFRDQVTSVVSKRHDEERRHIESMIKHLNEQIRAYQAIEQARRNVRGM